MPSARVSPVRSWHDAWHILDSSLTDARKRHVAAVTAKASASDAEVHARDAASAAIALLADLRSQEHEIETLARKVDEMGRHKQVLVDFSRAPHGA